MVYKCANCLTKLPEGQWQNWLIEVVPPGMISTSSITYRDDEGNEWVTYCELCEIILGMNLKKRVRQPRRNH